MLFQHAVWVFNQQLHTVVNTCELVYVSVRQHMIAKYLLIGSSQVDVAGLPRGEWTNANIALVGVD